jgi:DnaK suppressor protein
MNKKDLNYFTDKLVAEKAVLEQELGEIGKRNPSSNKGWEATSGGMKVDSADDNEMADKFGEIEENTGILNQLDSQLIEVNAALDRIQKGTYGLCEVCGKPIEKERLDANPAARVSIKHGHDK